MINRMHQVEPTVDVSGKLCDLDEKAIPLLKSKVRNLIDLDSVGYLGYLGYLGIVIVVIV